MNKYGIVILSNPNHNQEESLGRVLNALVLANDLNQQGKEFQIFFQGTGTLWVNLLEDASHPGHALYMNVKQKVKGASKACADIFKANVTTLPLLEEFHIPNVGGATSLAKYMLEGYHMVSF
ncbi:hypothetical protein phytr_160 [Candidatus Phycorickettsia trachydisci]|uniref:Uncharacterized protein n=1 Tax=Candidatus Phycorickettsia trachydisci TaxID=2115978 RepID=A0A2P1P6T8_9RICK|nr:DsrE family protein [Candidatus Phycorickettsia trachydisci]AVP86980.1 hypothetical protein phytr_160 [Candidatus Phycorickettsia trachydisci]